MFSGKLFLAASLALSTVNVVSGIKADCWYDEECKVTLGGPNGIGGTLGCLLPPKSAYTQTGTGDWTLPGGTAEQNMGVPGYFCGNRKSGIMGDDAAAKKQAKEFCFLIGAKSACIWGECHLPGTCMEDPGEFGDPHFQTWAGEFYDYHGVCDLLFLESKSHNLTVHVRTSPKFHYSYVSSAAVELNGDVIEVASYGAVIFNGVALTDEEDLPESVGGMRFKLDLSNKKIHTYSIIMNDDSALEISAVKDMVSVKLIGNKDSYADSRGLMGSSKDGAHLARDGETVLRGLNAFGQEWQVREDEKMLFDTPREPQAPTQCILPDKAQAGRRLGSAMAREQAEEACKHWGMNKEACISDVMATGDVDVAALVF